ncbi:MAG: hypothetical protein FWG37_00875 [Clostridia bacterium]|nr:hypothetical protein [Clostridia bacterium]
MRKRMIAVMLCALFLLSAAVAAAAPREQARRQKLGGIVWSGERLWQVLVNEKHLDFRIYANDEKQLFKLNFSAAETGSGLLMTLTIAGKRAPMRFAYTVEALDYLESIGVGQVRGYNGEDQIEFGTELLRSMLDEEVSAQTPADPAKPSVLDSLPIQDDPTLRGEDPMLP